MTSSFILSLLLLMHILLLLVKSYSVYFFISSMVITKAPNSSNIFVFKYIEFFMMIFSLILMFSEIYFIYNFYINITLYLYEFLAILDEILFTILAVYYIKKGVHNGKR